ncbi:MAG: DUF883 family protein [Leptospiraceae bacterium]|nr:DUF883 family protein [Leptospiraceae bacterium]MCP5502310.1 DUF883 family protein [Leptospiraceae bacterium]
MGRAEEFAREFKLLKAESNRIKQRARENYLEQVSDFSEKIKHMGDEAGTKAKQVIDKVGDYITKNPQKSALVGLGVGIGLGLAIGLLIRRK